MTWQLKKKQTNLLYVILTRKLHLNSIKLVKYIPGELCGDSPDTDVSIGEADLPVLAEGWGTKDMISSSNTLK